MSYVEVEHARYFTEKRGEGTPLVLLHGFTGSAQGWLHLMERWSRSLMTIAPDLPGHGHTVMPEGVARYTMENTARDVALVIASETADAAWLLGYSMGGRLALYLALHHPEQVCGLILESASPGLRTEAERRQRRESDHLLARRIEEQGVASFIDYWEALPLFASQRSLGDEQRARQRAQRLANSAVGLANSLRGMGTGEQPSLWERLFEVHVPVLLVTGALDEKFTEIAREMLPLLPNAQLSIIPDAGHTVHLECPDLYAQTVARFIEGN